VRERAATELVNAFENVKFCESEDEDPDEFDDTEIQQILTETQWKDDFDACARGVTELCRIFGVPIPPIEKKEVQQQKRKFDYGALVKDAG
jgi:hypothetical protein